MSDASLPYEEIAEQLGIVVDSDEDIVEVEVIPATYIDKLPDTTIISDIKTQLISAIRSLDKEVKARLLREEIELYWMAMALSTDD